MVKGYTRRSRKGRLVLVRSYTRQGERRAEGFTFQPDRDTAAVYDPSRPGKPFRGRIAEGQRVPRGLRRYRFDDTKLVQARIRNRRTLGRTEDPYTRFD